MGEMVLSITVVQKRMLAINNANRDAYRVVALFSIGWGRFSSRRSEFLRCAHEEPKLTSQVLM